MNEGTSYDAANARRQVHSLRHVTSFDVWRCKLSAISVRDQAHLAVELVPVIHVAYSRVTRVFVEGPFMKQHARRLLGLALGVLPLTALAHTGDHGESFFAGLSHPFTGVDHLLAMVAVGMLASRLTGASRWLLPASFIAAMIFGCGLAFLGIGLPFVEGLIALSLLAFGVLLFSNRTLSTSLGCAVVALFGLFHGHAHGSEMMGASLMTYGVGFVLATAALHAAGLLATLRVEAWTQRVRTFFRVTGSAIAFTGALLLLPLT